MASIDRGLVPPSLPRWHHWLAVAGGLLLSQSCTPAAPPHYSPDWSRDVAGSCDRAGQVLAALGCIEASPPGIPWGDFCQRAQASEGAIDLDVGCLERAATVEAVRACHVRCRREVPAVVKDPLTTD